MANATGIARTVDHSPANHSARPSNSSSGLSSPWSQIVRGSDSESHLTALDSFLDSDRSPAKPSDDAGDVQGKKLAWKTPPNGVVEVGPVMGADSWPPLSESAKASPKSSSDHTVLASTQVPVITSSLKKSIVNNQNPNTSPTPAQISPALQKSNDPDTPRKTSGKPAVAIPESSLQTKNNNWETGVRGGYSGNDQQHRSLHRRGNSGPHHNSYGNRRDPERVNYDRNHPPRSFGGRDVHMQQQRGIPRNNFMRPPPPPPPPLPSSTPYIGRPPPLPVRPFVNPMGFHDMTSQLYYFPGPPPESIRGVPYIAHSTTPPPLFFPASDPRIMLAKQIEYYFSPDNLCKDLFLRRKMDEQGWVPVSLIASFNRVKQLTNNIPFILDAVWTSSMLEVQGDKIRKRNDWMNWVLPPSSTFATVAGSQSPTTSNYNMLETRIQRIEIEGTTNNNSMRTPAVEISTERVLSRSSSGELNSLSPVNMPSGTPNSEGIGQTTVQMGSELSLPERNTGASKVC